MNIIQKPVVNRSSREGHKIAGVVIHIAQGSLAGAYSWFNNPQSIASSHYMVGKNGEIWQFVPESMAAWHAGGVSSPSQPFLAHHSASVNPNLWSIGIECEGSTGERFTTKMVESIRELIGDIAKRYGWAKYKHGDNLLGHSDINSISRGMCPGVGVHLTDDLISPVNIQLNIMKDQALWDTIQAQRADAEGFIKAGYSADNILAHWDKWGYMEFVEALGRAWDNGNIQKYVSPSKLRSNSFMPKAFMPRELRDLYVTEVSKGGNIWEDKVILEPANTAYVTKQELKELFTQL